MAVRTCRVSCRDLRGIEYTVEVTADSLYEAVAQALRTFREDTSVDEIVGDRIQTVATVKDSKGNALGKKASWSSSNPGVAEVEVDGNLTAKGPGETTVVASMGFIKGVVLAHVRHVTVASVEVFPPATTLEVDGHLKFDATPHDSDGNSLLGRPVRWSSENSSVAAAEESSGDVTGRSVAAVKVTAVVPVRLVPVIVTFVPPLCGPDVGFSDVNNPGVITSYLQQIPLVDLTSPGGPYTGYYSTSPTWWPTTVDGQEVLFAMTVAAGVFAGAPRPYH